MKKSSKTTSNSSKNSFDFGYPRPQLQRAGHVTLNGEWELAIDPEGTLLRADEVTFDKKIQAPFSPETPLSGVEYTEFFKACWYRRTFEAPALADGERLLLHFEAVDYEATVWVNDQVAVKHEGGYTPFSADITDLLVEGEQTVVVHVKDNPHDMEKPRGKQDWLLKPHVIWYMRTTGIWQSVWLERVPKTYLSGLRWNSDFVNWKIDLDVCLKGEEAASLRLNVKLRKDGKILSDTTTEVNGEAGRVGIALPDPGIDDARHWLQWSPESPNLIDADLELYTAKGELIDKVQSYCAMRSVGTEREAFTLNGYPYRLRMVLNQSYWKDGGLTAPGDEGYRRDVELLKEMGFNGARLHQKIESPRFLYWADKLGLMVWEELPSPYAFSQKMIERISKEWVAAMKRDVSHPCIVTWVPFNESWGVPRLPGSEAQRNLVRAMYYLTKAFDPTRPAIGNDGWENVETDIITVHDYAHDGQILADRYGGDFEKINAYLKTSRTGGRQTIMDGMVEKDRPCMLTEFGGIAFTNDKAAWGYSKAATSEDLEIRFGLLMEHVRHIWNYFGWCYTQLTDTYQEANGLLYMDRTPKIPMKSLAVAIRGPHTAEEHALVASWKAKAAKKAGK